MILGFLQEEELESRVVNDHAVAQILGTETNALLAFGFANDVCLVKAPGFGGECLLNKPFGNLVVIAGGLVGKSGHNLVITLGKEGRLCDSADIWVKGFKTPCILQTYFHGRPLRY